MIHARESLFRQVGLRVVVEPEVEQITLAEAYAHLRLDGYGSPPSRPDDDLISLYISAAREWCEGYVGRALAPQVLELSAQQFPGAQVSYYGTYPPQWSLFCQHNGILLPMAPIAGVESISYLDVDGTSQTVDAYLVDNSVEPSWLYPLYGVDWPIARQQPGSVRIRYHAGYTLPTDSPNDRPLPKRYKSAMLLMLGLLYENREQVADDTASLTELPFGVKALLEWGRLRLSMA